MKLNMSLKKFGGPGNPKNVNDDEEAMLAEDKCVHEAIWRPW